MNFLAVRRKIIEALETGAFEHEDREVRSEKNLLATGEVHSGFVIRLLHRCRGDQYRTSRHHGYPDLSVHIFQPELEGERWYIKAYFDESPGAVTVFISIHR